MTENEAIKHLQSYAEVVGNMIKYCKDFEPKADITGYLEKKTVFAMAISALKEVQKYSEIGTVEECREAVEKQKPKAPKDSIKIKPVIDENGAYVDADVTVYLLCPNCGEMVGIDENVDKFCHECGQAIQWDNLEGTEDENT